MDILIRYDGSKLFLVRGLTKPARDWLDEHVDAQLTWGANIVVEDRYIEPLLDGLAAQGSALFVALQLQHGAHVVRRRWIM